MSCREQIKITEMVSLMSRKIPFEKQIERLENIVRILERGDAPLEESLELFEEGAKLVKDCNRILDNAEKKVMMLSLNKDNQPIEVTFDREANADE